MTVAEAVQTKVVQTKVVQATPEETAADVQLAYDRVANPEKVQAEQDVVKEVEEKATETPPEEPQPEAPDELADLRKRLDDVNGRYGRLSQRLEETMTKLATPAKTQSAADASVVDVEDMLKDVKEAFGDDELYTSLKSAFSKVLANKGSVDPDSINKLVANRLAAERSEERDSSLKYIVGDSDNPGRHPDFFEAKAKPEFTAWKKTLPAGERSLFSQSEDPVYVADMMDEFKAWVKAENQKATTSHQKSRSRIEAAVLPTSGTRATAKGEPVASEQVRAAYERIAGKRI